MNYTKTLRIFNIPIFICVSINSFILAFLAIQSVVLVGMGLLIVSNTHWCTQL